MAGAYNKVIYICYLPLSDKIYNDFFIDFLLDRKVCLEYWDVSRIYFKDMRFGAEQLRTGNYIRSFNSMDELGVALNKEDVLHCVFIPIITFEGRVLNLFKLLSKHKCNTAFFARGGLPVGGKTSNFINKILGKESIFLSSKKLVSTLTNSFAKLYKALKIVSSYGTVFCSGQIAIDTYSKESKVVKINYFDYDTYLLQKHITDRLVEDGPYCVFLDDHLVDDFDYQIIGIKGLTAETYYKELNNFFDLVEEKHKLKVVIAAHPKSNYIKNEFRNRIVIKNKTNELVKDCDFVMAHYSSSVSYAVCHKKPVLFMSTEEMTERPYYVFIRGLSEALGSKILNISNISDDQNIVVTNIDENKYDKYKYDFLTSKESETMLSREIFLEYLCGRQH